MKIKFNRYRVEALQMPLPLINSLMTAVTPQLLVSLDSHLAAKNILAIRILHF